MFRCNLVWLSYKARALSSPVCHQGRYARLPSAFCLIQRIVLDRRPPASITVALSADRGRGSLWLAGHACPARITQSLTLKIVSSTAQADQTVTNTTSRLLDASTQALSSFQQNLTNPALTALTQTEQLLTLLQQTAITNVTNGVSGILDGVLANATSLLTGLENAVLNDTSGQLTHLVLNSLTTTNTLLNQLQTSIVTNTTNQLTSLATSTLSNVTSLLSQLSQSTLISATSGLQVSKVMVVFPGFHYCPNHLNCQSYCCGRNIRPLHRGL